MIVPMYQSKVILSSKTNIKRIPIGGRHMVNMLKYYMSYRQYNLMDQEIILQDILERLCYISLLNIWGEKDKVRDYDRDYLLPDYITTFHGQIQLPLSLQRRLVEDGGDENENDDGDDDDDDDDDEDVNSENVDDDMDDDNDNDSQVNSDDEETDDQRRRRIMKQRAEEERRKRETEEEQQILRVSMERFAVPEVLFRPLDAGLTPDLVGLAEAIHQSVQACPRCYHAPLYQSICLTGGVSQLPNLKERLERDLRRLVPNELDMKVTMVEDPIFAAWKGAQKWINSKPYTEWSVSREEWESSSKRRAYKRLLVENGGIYM